MPASSRQPCPFCMPLLLRSYSRPRSSCRMLSERARNAERPPPCRDQPESGVTDGAAPRLCARQSTRSAAQEQQTAPAVHPDADTFLQGAQAAGIALSQSCNQQTSMVGPNTAQNEAENCYSYDRLSACSNAPAPRALCRCCHLPKFAASVNGTSQSSHGTCRPSDPRRPAVRRRARHAGDGADRGGGDAGDAAPRRGAAADAQDALPLPRLGGRGLLGRQPMVRRCQPFLSSHLAGRARRPSAVARKEQPRLMRGFLIPTSCSVFGGAFSHGYHPTQMESRCRGIGPRGL